MIPTFVGMLAVLGALLLVALGLSSVAIGFISRRRGWVKGGIRIAAVAVGGWAVLWVVGWLFSPKGVLPTGQELSFCGTDCHVSLSVVSVSRDQGLAVQVRFRNDARSTSEPLSEYLIAVEDGRGGRYFPISGIAAGSLAAGEAIIQEYRFAVAPEVTSPRLVASYHGWMDYLVPGQGNPLVQRRVGLAL